RGRSGEIMRGHGVACLAGCTAGALRVHGRYMAVGGVGCEPGAMTGTGVRATTAGARRASSILPGGHASNRPIRCLLGWDPFASCSTVILLPVPLWVLARCALVHPQPRLDCPDAPLEFSDLPAQRSVLVIGCRGYGQALHGDPRQVILGEAERPGQARQRRAVAGLFVAMLDFPQCGRGDPRSLGEFSLGDSPGRHPVVDGRRDIGPVRQGGLPLARTVPVLTAGYPIRGP